MFTEVVIGRSSLVHIPGQVYGDNHNILNNDTNVSILVPITQDVLSQAVMVMCTFSNILEMHLMLMV